MVTRTDYVFDAAAPGGMLAPAEKARLDSWFRGLELGYGDFVYVDAPGADAARYDVAQVAGNYGMLLQPGVPVTAGAVNPGSVRVVVTVLAPRFLVARIGVALHSRTSQSDIVELRLRLELGSRPASRKP